MSSFNELSPVVAALVGLLAMLGFVSTAALARFLLRGEVIE
jgi:multisubunit Na+/H+ antiporter MnhF subunit